MTEGSELGDVYGVTIERIKAQGGDKSRLGMAALMWVSHAERPLRADELCHALGVKLGSSDFNASNAPSILTLIRCRQGLITVDKEASTMRLIHFTLQEYLSAHQDIFSGPHSAMAEICLTFLNSQQIKALSADPSPDTQNTPFLEYCSVYWGAHAKREFLDCVRSPAVELLKENDGWVPTELLLKQATGMYFPRFENFALFSELHRASFFGIVEVVATLIEMECYNINEGDFLGRTLVAWAADNGHEEVLRILLRREEVSSDKPDTRGKIPLVYAAKCGYSRIVKLPLEREEVILDKLDNYGRTPLLHPA